MELSKLKNLYLDNSVFLLDEIKFLSQLSKMILPSLESISLRNCLNIPYNDMNLLVSSQIFKQLKELDIRNIKLHDLAIEHIL